MALTEDNQLVGINSNLKQFSSLLTPNSDDVILVGIHGMGGIGKTTIARVCYERIRDEFEAHCFLSNVREKFENNGGLPSLQSKLLSRTFSVKNNDIWDAEEGIALIKKAIFQKKTLLVLDDVDHSDQLTGLIPNKDFFGYGSRIIITTRNADLLSTFGVEKMYKVEKLEYEEALQLLSLSAFMKTCPKQGYLEHSKSVVKLVGGHPLALKLLGSSLRNKDLGVWNCVIEELQGGGDIIHDNIFKCLKVSYDGLDEKEKEVFLDVACFFKGKRRDLVEEILDGCGFYAKRRVELLIQKSLITMSYDNKLQMHDLLQEMGWRIVRQKPVQDRLWFHKDIKCVMTEASIQSIIFKSTRTVVEIPVLLSRMHQLRLLNLHNVRLQNHLEYCIPTELRFLKWKEYPWEFLPLSSEEYKLIELHMCHSNLKQFWQGEKYLEKLKYIKLNHSQKLFKTPDFAQVPYLKRLELEGCTNLVTIHPSIFTAKELIFLSLKDCINLTNLPREITIEVLEVFILSGCSKLRKIPEFTGNTDRLLQLHLDDTSIEDLPPSITSLTHLKMLSLKNCKRLFSIPTAIERLTSVWSLNFFGCSKLINRKRKLDINAKCLEELNLRGTAKRRGDNPNQGGFNIVKRLFPWFYKVSASSIFSLYSLTKLNLNNCKLKAIPEAIECLVSLRHLNLSGNNFSQLPTSISRLHNLTRLEINRCMQLSTPPVPPRGLVKFLLINCVSLSIIPKISQVDHSYFMNLLNCYQLADNKELYNLITSWMHKTFSKSETMLNIMIPGGEIPEWFTITKNGSSISVGWDPNAPNANLIRFALCVVCGPTDRDSVTSDPFVITASLTVNEPDDQDCDERDFLVNGFFVSGMRKLDHVWLFVMPQTNSMTSKIKKCREIEFRFNLRCSFRRIYGSNIKLKKCGVCLINMEEEKKAMERHTSTIYLSCN